MILTASKTHHSLGVGMTTFIALWGIVSEFVTAFQCGSVEPWRFIDAGNTCIGLVRFACRLKQRNDVHLADLCIDSILARHWRAQHAHRSCVDLVSCTCNHYAANEYDQETHHSHLFRCAIVVSRCFQTICFRGIDQRSVEILLPMLLKWHTHTASVHLIQRNTFGSGLFLHKSSNVPQLSRRASHTYGHSLNHFLLASTAQMRFVAAARHLNWDIHAARVDPTNSVMSTPKSTRRDTAGRVNQRVPSVGSFRCCHRTRQPTRTPCLACLEGLDVRMDRWMLR